MNKWYENLKKSSLTPPSYVFGPVWASLYTLMGISLIVYLNSGYTTRGLILFGAQLAINLMWSGLFFGQRLICGSVLNVAVMNILVFFTYLEFKKSSAIAANLLLPYIAWILLAAYLNLYICVNN
jgi:tryptophan-rich sensory protein